MSQDHGNSRCSVCSAFFKPTSPRQTTCSAGCRRELERRRKAAWWRTYTRPPRPRQRPPERACDWCGRTYQPDRRNSRFCSRECRTQFYHGAPVVSAQQVEAEREEHRRQAGGPASMDALAKLEAQAEFGRLLRHQHGDVLEEQGLPGHFGVAAALLGITEGTLRRRVGRGTDILKPLRRSRTCGRSAPIPLNPPPQDALGRFPTRPSERERMLADLRAEAPDGAAAIEI